MWINIYLLHVVNLRRELQLRKIIQSVCKRLEFVWFGYLGKVFDKERRLVVRSHSVGDADGGGVQAVRLAQWRSADRHAASLVHRVPARRLRPAVTRRYGHRRRRMSARAGGPDAAVLERRRSSAPDVRRHQRLSGSQERRVLPATDHRTPLATFSLTL